MATRISDFTWSVLPLGTATGRAPVSKILTVANRLMALPEVNANAHPEVIT